MAEPHIPFSDLATETPIPWELRRTLPQWFEQMSLVTPVDQWQEQLDQAISRATVDGLTVTPRQYRDLREWIHRCQIQRGKHPDERLRGFGFVGDVPQDWRMEVAREQPRTLLGVANSRDEVVFQGDSGEWHSRIGARLAYSAKLGRLHKVHRDRFLLSPQWGIGTVSVDALKSAASAKNVLTEAWRTGTQPRDVVAECISSLLRQEALRRGREDRNQAKTMEAEQSLNKNPAKARVRMSTRHEGRPDGSSVVVGPRSPEVQALLDKNQTSGQFFSGFDPNNPTPLNLDERLDPTLEEWMRALRVEVEKLVSDEYRRNLEFVDSALDATQFILDVLGLIPFLGVVPDAINSGISIHRGQYLAATPMILGIVVPSDNIVRLLYKLADKIETTKFAAKAPQLRRAIGKIIGGPPLAETAAKVLNDIKTKKLPKAKVLKDIRILFNVSEAEVEAHYEMLVTVGRIAELHGDLPLLRKGMPAVLVKDAKGNLVPIFGSPNSSSATKGHDATAWQEAVAMATSGDMAYVVIDRSLRTSTARAVKSKLRPDVFGRRRDFVADITEVQSMTNKHLEKKSNSMMRMLPKEQRGKPRVIEADPSLDKTQKDNPYQPKRRKTN